MTPVSASTSLLLTRLNDTRIGFSAKAVREILRSVAIAPLSGAPDVIEGAINLRGTIIPVVDVRRRLGLAASANAPDQFLVLLEISDRVIAVRVDDVDDVVEVEGTEVERSEALSPALQGLAGVAATADGALVIYDADAFLTQAEREVLDAKGSVRS
ncbi:MAG: chemotaxis protein CheW [Gemmatimonadota bacterium]|nr:chemotaxis protein CheW [Gemmatimonadota bacterium]